MPAKSRYESQHVWYSLLHFILWNKDGNEDQLSNFWFWHQVPKHHTGIKFIVLYILDPIQFHPKAASWAELERFFHVKAMKLNSRTDIYSTANTSNVVVSHARPP